MSGRRWPPSRTLASGHAGPASFKEHQQAVGAISEVCRASHQELGGEGLTDAEVPDRTRVTDREDQVTRWAGGEGRDRADWTAERDRLRGGHRAAGRLAAAVLRLDEIRYAARLPSLLHRSAVLEIRGDQRD
jgi:hypothetical protein